MKLMFFFEVYMFYEHSLWSALHNGHKYLIDTIKSKIDTPLDIIKKKSYGRVVIAIVKKC